MPNDGNEKQVIALDNNESFDRKVLAAIASGISRAGLVQVAVKSAGMRMIDRSLQRLRRRGLITYLVGQGWKPTCDVACSSDEPDRTHEDVERRRAYEPGSDDELRTIFLCLLAFVAGSKVSNDAKDDAVQCIKILQARLLP